MEDPKVRIHCEAWACKWNKSSHCECSSIFIQEEATRSLLGDIQTYRRCTNYEENEKLSEMVDTIKKLMAKDPLLFSKAFDELLNNEVKGMK